MPDPFAATDDEVLDGLRSGDHETVTALVRAWSPAMLRLARARGTTQAVAEEVVQESWLIVLGRLDAFDGRSRLRTWVLGIVANVARRHRERESRSLPFSEVFVGDAAADPTRSGEGRGAAASVEPARFHPPGIAGAGTWLVPPARWDLLSEDQLDSAELSTVIDEAIEALPERQRVVMTARDVLGLSSAEVSELLEITGGHERVLLHRARSRVRAVVESYGLTKGAVAEPDAAITPSWARRARQRWVLATTRQEAVVCRQLVELVTEYLDGALDRGQRARVEAHLARCGHCHGYVAQVRRLLLMTRRLPEGTPDPQLVARLRDALGPSTR